MENSIILQNIDGDGLKAIIKGAVREELAAIQPKKDEVFLTRAELAKKLHISLVTLDKAARDGKIKGYRINGRVLFKDSEISLDAIPIRKRR
jgi:excisionase family DNA binding protein